MRIIVLGSGVIGVTSAYELARDGHEVTVIDRQPVSGNETSFANTGLIAPGHSYTWNSPQAPKILLRSLYQPDQALRLKLRADPAMWAWGLRFLRNCTAERARRFTLAKLRLCQYSQAMLHQVVDNTNVEFERRTGGCLYVYRNQPSLARGAEKMKILQEGGVDLALLSPREMAQVEPAFEIVQDKVAGAIHAKTDESGDANMFTRNLAAHCAQMGVEFRYETTVNGLAVERGAISHVETSAGRVQGDAYVVSLGSYSPFLLKPLGIRIHVYPVKGYSVTIPVEGSNLAPTLGGVDENNLFGFARYGDRLRLTSTAEISGFDREHRPNDFRQLLTAAKDLFPQGGDYGRPTYWTGLRPMTPEGTPIISRSVYPNLYLNTGHGHMGWTMSCGSARALADIIKGTTPEVDLREMSLQAA